MSSLQTQQKHFLKTFQKGHDLYLHGDHQAAIAFFQNFLAHSDDGLRNGALFYLSHIFFDLGQADQALDLLTQGLHVSAHDTLLLIQKAGLLSRLNRLEEARELLQNTLSQVNQNADLWAAAADICLKEGNLPWANTCAQRALEYDGKNDRASHIMSTLAVLTEDFHEAEHINFHMLYNADLEERISGNGHVNMANAFFRRGMMPMALHHHKKRHEETSDSAEYYPGLANFELIENLSSAKEPVLIASEGDSVDQLRFLGLLAPILRARKGDIIEVHPMLLTLVSAQFSNHKVIAQQTRPFLGKSLHIYEDLPVKHFMYMGDILHMVDDFETKSWIQTPAQKQSHEIAVLINSTYAGVLPKALQDKRCVSLNGAYTLGDQALEKHYQEAFEKCDILEDIVHFLKGFKALVLEPSVLKELAQGSGCTILEVMPGAHAWHLGHDDISPFSPKTKLCKVSTKAFNENAFVKTCESFLKAV